MADDLADDDLDRLSDRALLDSTVELDRQITRLTAQRDRRLAAVVRRGAYRTDGCVTAGSWWAGATGRDPNRGARVVRTATRLHRLDETREAYERGAITRDHAEVIARYATPRRADAIAEHEDTLVRLATRARPKDVARACQLIADQVDPDGTDPKGRSYADPRRELFLSQLPDHRWDLRATLDELTGERLWAQLTARTRPPGATGEGAAAERDGRSTDIGAAGADGGRRGVGRPASAGRPDSPGDSAGSADAGGQPASAVRPDAGAGSDAGSADSTGAAATSAGGGHDAGADAGDGGGEADRRTPAQARHDAFADLVRAAEAHGDAPTRHGSKPHVLLTLDLWTLLGRPDRATRRPRYGSGAEIDPDRLADLLRDAGLTDLVMTFGPFRPVAFGSTRRVLPTWARRALHLVHRHCRGPGCDRPTTWGDAAHLDPWARDHNTRLDRSIPLCRAHHTLLDTGGWSVDYDPDTAIADWTAPGGRTITTHPPPP